MKTYASRLIRCALVLVLLLGMGTISSAQVQAAGPVPQAPLAGLPSARVSPPPPGKIDPSAWAWYDGVIKYSNITSCPPYPISEYGAGVYVSTTEDFSDNLPTTNMPYYVRVVAEIIGNTCAAGQYFYIDIGLPPNTTPAISTTNPIICYENGSQIPAECPQTLYTSTANSGMYEVRGPAVTSYLWELPEGWPLEIRIPLVSTAPVSGSNFEAAIHVIDGEDDPWLYPTEPTYVFAAPVPGAFNKSTPANTATKQSSSPTLKWGTSSGATSYQYCIDTSNNNTCNNSWVSTGTATSKALSGLAQGKHYYWQVRAKNAYGYTYANGGSTAWWSFTTLALPGAFNKSSPAKGATNQATNPTLKWGTSSGVTSYEYCIDTSNNNTCNTSWHSTGTATSKALSGLAHGTHYYWQVRAKNTAGTTYANGGSTVWWSFTVH